MKFCLLLLIVLFTDVTMAADDLRPNFALALHGGAGTEPENMTAAERATMEKSLAAALAKGEAILKDGGDALDAVEQVIRILEDDPQFNAGKGAVFNSAGKHELDASIMDGRKRRCGAVAGVKTVKNPISLARLVMTQTKHVLLGGSGADEFAKEMQVELVDNSYFSTDKQRAYWEQVKAEAEAKKKDRKGTVGCVALDRKGNLAAGTSTGGMTNKRYGRVGDSPIIGAGTFADNDIVAVSCTGTGEQYIRNAVAYDLAARLSYKKQPLKEAVDEILRQTLDPGDGGLIAIDRAGNVVLDYTSDGMARASLDFAGKREIKLGR